MTKITCKQCGNETEFVEMSIFDKLSTASKWEHILVHYLDHMKPVPARMVQWILAETAPKNVQKPD